MQTGGEVWQGAACALPHSELCQSLRFTGLAAGNITGLISESPEVPVGFVQSHYSFSAMYTSLLKHGETLVVFDSVPFISILFQLGSYPWPTDMFCEHIAVAGSCVLLLHTLTVWHTQLTSARKPCTASSGATVLLDMRYLCCSPACAPHF